MEELEGAVPRRFGSLEDRKTLPDRQRTSIAFELRRQPFQVSVIGDVARLEAIAATVPAGSGTPRTQDLLALWGANLAASAGVLERVARG